MLAVGASCDEGLSVFQWREEKEEGISVFQTAVEEMRREGQDAVERSAQKRQHIAQLQKEMDQLRDLLTSRYVPMLTLTPKPY